MASWVSDSDLGYAKSELVWLAEEYPAEARLSANNYMLYTAQNSLSYEEYTSVSDSWGANTFSPDCRDMYSNCIDFARDCCGNRFLNGWNGDLVSDVCCASCRLFDSSDECIAINGSGPSIGFEFDPNAPGGGVSATSSTPPPEVPHDEGELPSNEDV